MIVVADGKCMICFERDAVHTITLEDQVTHRLELFDVCDPCYIEARASQNAGGKFMPSKFSVVVSLPKGVTETNFADNVGMITPKKRQDGSVVTMKSGKGVYTMALNLTKLRSMIDKHKLVKKDKRSNDDVVWLTVFERDAASKANASGAI